MVQHRNYNCATQILIRNLSENVVSIVGGIISIIEAFPAHVLCVQTRKSRNTLSFDKVSVVYLQGKQFLSNVNEAVYRRQ